MQKIDTDITLGANPAAAKAPKPRVARAVRKGEEPSTERANAASAANKTAEAETKASTVLKKLRTAKGATIATIMELTGWQAHSVRGFLSAVVRKKLKLDLMSETGKDGVRRYRVRAGAGA